MYDLRFQGIENCQDLILLSFADPAFVQRIENVVKTASRECDPPFDGSLFYVFVN
jgi:hypothetical protein